MDFFLLATLCALQMKRKSKLQQKNVSKATLAATAKREAKRANVTAEASSGAAPVDSGTDPPPSGALIAPPTAQVRSNRPLRLLPLLRTLQPQQSLHSQPGRNAEHAPLPTYVSSSLPVEATALVTHAPMRRAVTQAATALRYTALRCAAVRWKALCCSALALHRAAHWQLSPSSTPTARVRTLRFGAGWSCGSDGDRRVLRNDDAAFVEPGS